MSIFTLFLDGKELIKFIKKHIKKEKSMFQQFYNKFMNGKHVYKYSKNQMKQ